MAKKECPFCKKRIPADVSVCKYCKRDLSKSPKTFLRGNVLIALVIIVVVIGLWIWMRQSSTDTSSPYPKQTPAVEKQVKKAEMPQLQEPKAIISPEQPDEPITDAEKIVQDTCNEQDRLVIIPDMAIRHSKNTDRVLFFDTRQSFCYEIVNCVKRERDCSYKWDFGGPGDVVGGNGKDVVVYRYDTVGEYEASVSMTETVSGKEATDYILVVAESVQPVLPFLDFSTTVEESTAILSVGVLEDIVQLLVFWGDRSRSEYSSPFNESIEHTYTRSGKYRLRVQVVDNEGNIFNYTIRNNANLIVEIP